MMLFTVGSAFSPHDWLPMVSSVLPNSFGTHRTGTGQGTSTATLARQGTTFDHLSSPSVWESAQAQQLQQDLSNFAHQDPARFRQALQQAFGGKVDAATLDRLLDLALSGDLPMPAKIRFVDAGALGENNFGAYSSADGGTIFLDRRLLSDPQQLQAVFTEEVGHHLDAFLGGSDAAGDEGAIFAQSLSEGALSPSRLMSLKAENDHGVIVLDGQRLSVEFNYDEVGIDTPASSTSTSASSTDGGNSMGGDGEDNHDDTTTSTGGSSTAGSGTGGSDDHGYDEVGIDTPASKLDQSTPPGDDNGDGDDTQTRSRTRTTEPQDWTEKYGHTGPCNDCHGTLPDPDAVTTDADRQFMRDLGLDMTLGMTGIGGIGLGAYRAVVNPSIGTLGSFVLDAIPGPNIFGAARRGIPDVDIASVPGGSTFRDANGRLRNSDGTFAPDGGTSTAPAGTHGNTAGNQPATLYERYDADGNFLKHGISQDPGRRYTQRELNGGYLIETQTGTRREMLDLERYLVETNPGPLNREPWAGRRRAE